MRWLMLFALVLVVVCVGCPWMDNAAIESQPDLDARTQAAIAAAVAKAAAEHREPTEAELVAAATAEVKGWQNDPARREALLKALAAAGIKVGTGDVLGGITGLLTTMVAGYLAGRPAEALGAAAVRKYRRRKIAGTPLTTT